MTSKRGPGRPPGNTTAATRAELLRHGRRIFAERGYEGASTTEIVEAAGVSPSALYHHFGSKAALYTAALTEVIDLVTVAFEQAAAGKVDLADRLDSLLAVMPALDAQEPSIGPFMVSAATEVRRHPELEPAAVQLQRNRGLFERIVADGATGWDGEPEHLVRMCIALLWGLTGLSATSHDRSEFVGAIDALRALLAGRLGAGASQPPPEVSLSSESCSMAVSRAHR